MRRLFVLNSIFMAVLMTASIARAAECTIERDVLGTALRQASSCVRAYRVFEACSFGASGDVPLGTRWPTMASSSLRRRRSWPS